MSCDRHGSDTDDLYFLLRDLFCAAATTCFLWALHGIASGLKTEARLKTLTKLEDALTPEERELLIHKVKQHTLSA